MNLSLGSTSSSRAERDAIAAFPTMLFVAAAGNGGSDGVGDDNDAAGTYPCAYLLPNVVCVAASDNRDQHVSGAAALLWAAAPGSAPTDINSALLGGVDALPAFTGRTVSGGRLNVLRSLRLVADVGVGTPAPAPEPGSGSDAGPSGSPGGTVSSPTSGGVGDAVPPRLSIRTGRHLRAALFLRHRLRARVSCSEACRVRLTLRLHGRALAAPVKASLTPGVSWRVVLRLTRVGRVLVDRRRSLPLTLVGRAVDPAGNSRTVNLSLGVSR